jgi:hypothetical protein
MSVQNTAEIDVEGEATALYRMYGADGGLLYVGVTRNIAHRFDQHRDKPWWPLVARKTMAWYGSRADALVAEAHAIAVSDPLYNRRIPEPEYAYVKVADDIEARIRSGELAPGSQLPGEQVLRQRYGSALSTIRRAAHILRDRGLIVTRTSLGSFVVREIPPPQDNGSG